MWRERANVTSSIERIVYTGSFVTESATVQFSLGAYIQGDTSFASLLRTNYSEATGAQLQPELISTDDPIQALGKAEDPAGIVNALRVADRCDVADQLSDLLEDLSEDGDARSIVLESLRELARFLIDERAFEAPAIGVDPAGFVQAEWPVLENGLLVMNFRPDGLIRFVAVSGPAQEGITRQKESDTLPKTELLQKIRPFLVGI